MKYMNCLKESSRLHSPSFNHAINSSLPRDSTPISTTNSPSPLLWQRKTYTTNIHAPLKSAGRESRLGGVISHHWSWFSRSGNQGHWTARRGVVGQRWTKAGAIRGRRRGGGGSHNGGVNSESGGLEMNEELVFHIMVPETDLQKIGGDSGKWWRQHFSKKVALNGASNRSSKIYFAV